MTDLQTASPSATSSSTSSSYGRKRGVLGFIEGLSAASLFIAGTLPAPKTVHSSLASDWQAIGRDLRHATTAYGKKRHA